MKKSILNTVTIFAVTMLFCLLNSCTQPNNITNITNIFSKDAEEESSDFISELLPVYDARISVDSFIDTMFVRFYDEKKDIPYVAVPYYLEHYSNIPITNTSYSDHKYKYYGSKIDGKNFNIVVDTEKDTIYIPDWDFFVNPVADSASDILNTVVPGIGIMQNQKPVTIDLHKYGFKIYCGTDDAYVPLCVMNQLFSCYTYENYIFNGEAVFNVNILNFKPDTTYENFKNSPWYIDEKGNTAERHQELIDASYNLLCFNHEYLYGHPGYYGFADTQKKGYADLEIVKKADAMSLDELLTTYAPDVKNQLLSSSYKDYIIGLRKLLYYVYGDGHSGLIFSNFIKFDKEAVDEINNKTIFSPKLERIYNLDGSTPLSNIRSESGKKEGLELLSDGKTAVIRFDEFTSNADEWELYFNSSPNAEPDPKVLALPDDTLGFAYKSFYTLLNDAAYKDVNNVIIDLSNNSGGTEGCAYYFLLFMTDHLYFYTTNTTTKSKIQLVYCLADLNLDGNINEEDDKYRSKIRDKLNFAVLTSFHTFSAATEFSVLCAEAGIPIIGERSGGGCCSVISSSTADGFSCYLSRTFKHETLDGKSFEDGAPVTIEMPYKDFYDDAKLIAVMNELYGTKK